MTPWISTTWRSRPASSMTSPPPTQPPSVGPRIPAEIYSRILDHLDPVNHLQDRVTLARCLRVFQPYIYITAKHLYTFIDTRWMDTEKNCNPFKVTADNDPALFLPIARHARTSWYEIQRLEDLISAGKPPPPRPLEGHVGFCRFFVATNVDESIFYVLCPKLKPLHILHIPLSIPLVEYHRKAWFDEERGYQKEQPISRCLDYCGKLQAHTLVVNAHLPSQMAVHVRPMIPKDTTLFKGLKRLVVCTESWETIMSATTPFALPFIKYAPPKGFEEMVILHLPRDPKQPMGLNINEPGFRPMVRYSDGFFAGSLAQQFNRKSHKKNLKVLIVGIEYGSSDPFMAIDHQFSSKVELIFKKNVLEDPKVKAKADLNEVRERLESWSLMSLREYAKGLKGLDEYILPEYVWDKLEKDANGAGGQP